MSKRGRRDSAIVSDDQPAPDCVFGATTPTLAAGRAPGPAPCKKHTSDFEPPSAEGFMRCSLPPHKVTLSFSSYDDYEVHYLQTHVNRCSECGKNFPTNHFLNLHIEENHDPLICARRARGEKTYGCFVENCDRKCSTPQKRRLHLIDKHLFPKTYHFSVIHTGIDEQKSMLRTAAADAHRRRISTSSRSLDSAGQSLERRLRAPESQSSRAYHAASAAPSDGASHLRPGRLRQRWHSQTEPASAAVAAAETTAPKSNDEEMSELEKSMSALKFLPPSVAKRKGKQG